MPSVTALLISCLCFSSTTSTPCSNRPPRNLARIGTFALAPTAPAQSTPVAAGSGRVVVTISVEGVRVPAVNVALRSVDGNVVIGQTTSDAIGQVTFPDVPAGQYVIRAIRDGFAESESS